jgi:hypothetical protein
MANIGIEIPRARPVIDDRPRHYARIIVLSVLAGTIAAVLWPSDLMDMVIPHSVTSAILGQDAHVINGLLAGVLFAAVTGLANTFSACNAVATAAVAPLSGASGSGSPEVAKTVRSLGWLGLGAAAVAGTYGAIGALIGTSLPQLSEATVAGDIPVSHVQAAVVFGFIGLALVYLGLAELRLVPDVLAAASRRLPYARLAVLGALVGAASIGRPHPQFLEMFGFAAQTHNPAYGALVFLLQTAGNLVIVVALTLLLVHGTRGRFARWMTANAGRAAAITATVFLVSGAFTLLYWDVRLPV